MEEIQQKKSHRNGWKSMAKISGLINGCIISFMIYMHIDWWWGGLMVGFMTYAACKHAIEECQADEISYRKRLGL
jgi:hypothetical protein